MEHPRFSEILKDLYLKSIEPCKEPSFILYFIFMVVIFGGIGVFLSLWQYINGEPLKYVSQNMMTYAVALSVPAAFTIFLHVIPHSDYKVSHGIITLSILILQVITVCFSFWDGHFIIAIISTIISWWYWILANSCNGSLGDKSYHSQIKKDLQNHGTKWDNN